jgi:very-short-patch-repair endonuclease
MLNEIDEYIIGCIKEGKTHSPKRVLKLKETTGKDHRPIEELYSRSKGIDVPLCETCKEKHVKLFSINKGFRKYCSKECYKQAMSRRNSLNNAEFNKEKAKKADEQYSKVLAAASLEYKSNKFATIKQLEEKFGIPGGRLRKYLSENNLIDKSRQSRIYKKNLYDRLEKAHIHLSDSTWVRDKIRVENWTSKTFARELDCSKDFVCSKLRCNGIYLSDYRQYTSSYEEEISSMLNDMGIRHVRNDRRVLKGKELDIYIPSKKLAIEINGVYWHQDNDGNKKNYHLNKTLACEKESIRLLHITDKEMIFKPKLVENLILSSLGMNTMIYARKCSIKEISAKEFGEFVNENHFQGRINSSMRYGLFYDDDLLSVMGFSKSRFNKKYQYEITRFCNKVGFNVVGGASRLFSRFVKDVKPNSVISYCDRRLFTGKMYESIGMKFSHCTPPSYVWVHNNKDVTLSRYQTQKHLLNNCPEYISEESYMKENGYMRIYDSGQKVYTYEMST